MPVFTMTTTNKTVLIRMQPAPCRKGRSDDFKKAVALSGLNTIRHVVVGHIMSIIGEEAKTPCPDVRYVDAVEAAVNADWRGPTVMPGLTAIIHMLSHAAELCTVAKAEKSTLENFALTVDRIRVLYETGYAVPGPDLNDGVSRVAVAVSTAMELLFIRTCLKVNEDSDPRVVFDIDRENVSVHSEAIVTTWIQESLFADIASSYITVPFTTNDKANRALQKKVRAMVQGLKDSSSDHIVKDVLRYLRSILKVKTIVIDGRALTGRHVVAMRDDLMTYLCNTARQVLMANGTAGVVKTLHEKLNVAQPE